MTVRSTFKYPFSLAAAVVGALIAAAAEAADPPSERAAALAEAASASTPVQTLSCGQGTVSGGLTAADPVDATGAPYDLYSISVEEGEVITVSLAPRGFDGMVAVFDPDGEEVVASAGAEGDAFAAVETDRAGTWTVAAAPSSAAVGEYEIAVSCLSLPPADFGPCVEDELTLCLNDGRFRVEAVWETSQGDAGPGHARDMTGDTGYFWFFKESNVELVVKALDGCGVNGAFWVFAGGLTNVHTMLRVTDTVGDATRTYFNPQGKAFEPIQDTEAFATCGG